MARKKVPFYLVSLLGGTLALTLFATQPAIAQTQAATQTINSSSSKGQAAKSALKIDGSPTMRVINELFEQQYESAHPEVDINWQANGTDTALQKLLNGEIDLAAIGRPLTAAEKTRGLREIPVTLDNIAIIVGRNNPFDGALTMDQLRGIFRRDITDWAELGRSPGAIQVVDRPVDSDTRLVMQQYGILGDGTEGPASASVVQTNADDTVQVIKALGRDGISYAIAPQVINQKAVKLVKIAVLQNTLPGDAIYPYAETRSYAYLNNAAGPAQAFVGLAGAAAGKDIIGQLPQLESAAITEGLKPKPKAAAGSSPETEPNQRGFGFLLLLTLPLILLGLLLQALYKWLRRSGPAPATEDEKTLRSELLSPGNQVEPSPGVAEAPEAASPLSSPVVPETTSPQWASDLDSPTFQRLFKENLQQRGKILETATPLDTYQVLSTILRDRISKLPGPEDALQKGDAIIGELSAEYMPGPHLPLNLVNLGLLESMRQSLAGLGLNLDELVAQEEEPGLGRGGLGRLMVDYLEACATKNLSAIGYGIRYELGSFDQLIQDGWQVEMPDEWLKNGNPWEVEQANRAVSVQFGGRSEAYLDEQNRLRMRWQDAETVTGIPYDTYLPGYRCNRVSPMRLWKAEPTQDISTILYPVDAGYEGKRQRLKQQYFLVSCALQDILRMHGEAGHDITTLAAHVTLQLNDTDTILAIPELMRLLMDEYALDWDTAWHLTQGTFAYTNHSLLPEALDWRHYPLDLVGSLLPRHLEIIFDLNGRVLDKVRETSPDDDALQEKMSLIEESDERYVRMTNLACLGANRINGVSDLHGALLQQKLFPVYCLQYPKKFTTQTNGISQRRFLKVTNPALAALITEYIGEGWLSDLPQLQRLAPLVDDVRFQDAWRDVKNKNKQALADLIQQQTGVVINPYGLFDVQASILHEYKRPHLNLLHILTLYRRIKANPGISHPPRVFIFAGKAAPDYGTAKLIIRLIHAVADLVNNDSDLKGRLKVIFLPNFNLQASLPIFRAADLAEYLSLAGTEACATGNMIAALNGAVIIGTPDGSNLELFEAIGQANCFQFGLTQTEADPELYTDAALNSPIHLDAELSAVIDLLGSVELTQGNTDLFMPLIHRLQYDDPYLTVMDYRAYVEAQDAVAQAFSDRNRWTRQSILTTAGASKFSADEVVQGYWQNIWRSSVVSEMQMS